MQPDSVPTKELPSVRVLVWLSLAAGVVVALLGVAVVMPAETDRDPSGVGRMIGLSEMGRIKVALAKDAAGDSGATQSGAAQAERTVTSVSGSRWRDSLTVTLQPAQGIEVKMSMRTLEKAFYAWTTDGGEVYFNMHGEPPNAPKDYAAHRYGKGTSTAETGELVAAFDGVHGWFWRNRTEQPVKITLKTGGEYLVLKEMK